MLLKCKNCRKDITYEFEDHKEKGLCQSCRQMEKGDVVFKIFTVDFKDGIHHKFIIDDNDKGGENMIVAHYINDKHSGGTHSVSWDEVFNFMQSELALGNF